MIGAGGFLFSPKLSYFGAGFFYIKDNVLYLVSGKNSWTGFHAVFASVDLTTGKLLKYSMLDKNPAKGCIIDPQSTVWFNDGPVINYLYASGIQKTMKIVTNSEKLSY